MQGNLLYISNWASTPKGNSIEMYQKIHTNDGLHILFIGGVHGDEPEGVQLATDFLEWLKNNSVCHNWTLIPCLNVDGFRSQERTNGNGVDLNRNFPSQDWSPAAKAPRYFPGKFPNSEPEVQALVNWIDSHKPDLIIHFHSWEPSIVYTGKPGALAAEILARHSGYASQEDIGYPTPGSLGQYGWLEKKVPVICIEAQEKSDLSSIWPKFSGGLIELMTTRDWVLSKGKNV